MGIATRALGMLILLAVPTVPPAAHAEAPAVEGAQIRGRVLESKTSKPVVGALVILTCICMSRPRETTTDAQGHYAFVGLPPGSYSVQVLAGKADVSKALELPKHARFRANFRVDPNSEFHRVVRVKSTPVRKTTTVGREVGMEEFRNMPVGSAHSRDFTGIAESSPTARRESSGFRLADEGPNREGYAHLEEAAFLDVDEHPRSTFAADVDTASYANVRRFITHGTMPPPDAVRIEELVNYFHYDYATPPADRPIAVNWEIAESPWSSGHLLARIGLQTRPIAAAKVPKRNLVFLVDVSGSMNSPDKLPLLQRSMMLLVDQLREQDTVAMVVYAGASGIALEPTSGSHKAKIRAAIAELAAGGSTNGAAGIRDAYDLARKSFAKRGINRVILATDGDFNVGTTSDGELTRLIERERRSGVFLSVLGFGTGNVQDQTMELLADKGNGNYAYIDTLHEARKVLVEEAGATLATVAKDVKLQVEFNPGKVAAYRLIGYENRRLADEDFDDDRKDAGEMGAGHSVTALYEIVPVGEPSTATKAPKLRYQTARQPTAAARGDEWMIVKVRSKPADGDTSKVQEVPMRGDPLALAHASTELRFAAAVAQFGMLLRTSKFSGSASFAGVLEQARAARGPDEGGHREAFIDLVRATIRLADHPRRE